MPDLWVFILLPYLSCISRIFPIKVTGQSSSEIFVIKTKLFILVQQCIHQTNYVEVLKYCRYDRETKDTLQPLTPSRGSLDRTMHQFLSSHQPVIQNLWHMLAFMTVQGQMEYFSFGGVTERHVSIKQLLSSSKDGSYRYKACTTKQDCNFTEKCYTWHCSSNTAIVRNS